VSTRFATFVRNAWKARCREVQVLNHIGAAVCAINAVSVMS